MLKLACAVTLCVCASLAPVAPSAPAASTSAAAPQDDKPRPKKITISAGVAQGLLVRRVEPVYPAGAKVSGNVVLHITISTEGNVKDVQPISGNPQLQQAAIDAVKQWEYRPYLLNDKPVEVDTTVNVYFNHYTGPRI